MKRYKSIIIILVLLLSIALTSCSSSGNKEYEYTYSKTMPHNLHNTILRNIDLSYTDLNLTSQEEEVLEKYRQYGNTLRAGCYDWAAKSEVLTYEDLYYELGVSIFEVEAIEKILDINIGIEILPLSSGITGIETGQLDMLMNTYTRTSQIKNSVYLNDNTTTDLLYAYSLESITIEQATDLNGFKIGVLNDLNIFSDDMKQMLSDNDINYTVINNYISEYQALKALKNNEVDIVIQTFSTNMIQKGCSFTNVSQLFPDKLCNIAFSTLNEDIESIASVLEKLYDYNEYMNDLKHNYMEEYATMLVSGGCIFNDDEKELIQATQQNQLQLITQGDNPPYIYYNSETGEFSGVSYEVWDSVAEIAGINYNLVKVDNTWNEMLSSLDYEESEANVDAIIPANSTTLTQHNIQLSNPILTDEYVIVGLHSNSDIYDVYQLSGSKVGVVEGSSSTDVLRSYLPNEVFNSDFKDNDQLVNAVINKEIDYIILTEFEFDEYYYNSQLFDLAVKYVISPAYSTVAFADNEKGQILCSIFNKVYPYSHPEEIKKNYLSYNTNVNEVLRTKTRDLLIIIFLAFALIVTLFVFFIIRIRKTNEKVREIAFVDKTTGLLNRTAFYNDNKLAPASLMLVDIDNFKRINELFSHEAGDRFAFEIAQRIKELIDTQVYKLYTVSIDSILIVNQEEDSEDKIISIATKILYEISKGVVINNTEHKTTASIGIAFKSNEKDIEELYKKVDTALYIAKETGRNKYIIATDEVVAKHNKDQYLRERLTSKNIQNNIEPYFQPKVDIRDGRIIGLEALARWNDEKHGMIYPKEFLPIIDNSPDISILDISILAKSCIAYMEWKAMEIIDFNFIISCNVSEFTLAETDIVAVIKKLNKEIGIPYRALELEIAETAFTTKYTNISAVIKELANLGVNIAIDKFTADKSIMPMIAQSPINVLKVSKKLLKKGVTKESREKLNLMTSLAHNLNLGIVVNGVETQEQIQLLKEIPIYRAQGHYYLNAIPQTSIEDELRVKYIYKKA